MVVALREGAPFLEQARSEIAISRVDHDLVSVKLSRTAMDLAENRSALSNGIGNLETKTGEVFTVTGERYSKRAEVADLESCLRESSGTEVYMTELADI